MNTMAARDENYSSFLRLNVKGYSDKWVAIVDGDVVSSNKSFKATFKEAKAKFPRKRPLIAKIPSRKVMIL